MNSWVIAELVAVGPIVRYQQPAGEPPVDRVAAAAGRGLRDLGEEHLRVAQQQGP